MASTTGTPGWGSEASLLGRDFGFPAERRGGGPGRWRRPGCDAKGCPIRGTWRYPRAACWCPCRQEPDKWRSSRWSPGARRASHATRGRSPAWGPAGGAKPAAPGRGATPPNEARQGPGVRGMRPPSTPSWACSRGGGGPGPGERSSDTRPHATVVSIVNDVGMSAEPHPSPLERGAPRRHDRGRRRAPALFQGGLRARRERLPGLASGTSGGFSRACSNGRNPHFHRARGCPPGGAARATCGRQPAKGVHGGRPTHGYPR